MSFFVEKAEEKQTEKIVYETVKEAKKPDNSLNMTTLMILCENGEKSGTTFMIARFLSAEERIYLIPLPSDMVCQSGTETMTIYDFFRRYGCEKTLRAVSEAMNIQIEKYVFLDNTGKLLLTLLMISQFLASLIFCIICLLSILPILTFGFISFSYLL